jgi:hypothetical protein
MQVVKLIGEENIVVLFLLHLLENSFLTGNSHKIAFDTLKNIEFVPCSSLQNIEFEQVLEPCGELQELQFGL